MKEKEFSEHINAQTARIAAEDSRKLSLPATPEAYKVELPQDFKLPPGIEFKFDDADPALGEARKIAHQLGIPQDGFAKLLGVYAAAQVNSTAQVETARAAEVAKLGATGPARVGAITTFLKATLGDNDGAQIASRMFTAADVTIMEKLVAKFASQGTGTFSQQHRDVSAPGKVDQAAYDKMSYSEKKEYAAKFPQQAA